MDKVLAFSILSASPADVAAGSGAGRWARLSWRRGADDQGQAQAQARRPQEQRDGEEKPAGSTPPRAHGGGGKASLPRFAPEFDGIDCFETIVSH